jgi:hypothetical protein
MRHVPAAPEQWCLILDAISSGGLASTGMTATHMSIVPPGPDANTAAELNREIAIVWNRHINPVGQKGA